MPSHLCLRAINSVQILPKMLWTFPTNQSRMLNLYKLLFFSTQKTRIKHPLYANGSNKRASSSSCPQGKYNLLGGQNMHTDTNLIWRSLTKARHLKDFSHVWLPALGRVPKHVTTEVLSALQEGAGIIRTLDCYLSANAQYGTNCQNQLLS